MWRTLSRLLVRYEFYNTEDYHILWLHKTTSKGCQMKIDSTHCIVSDNCYTLGWHGSVVVRTYIVL